MPEIWIDNIRVDVDAGETILSAARRLGIDIPAMCSLPGERPNTSCMCCLVRVDGMPGVVPSCATLARDGMHVESETDAIHELRRTGIELLLSDHAGDCHAPCENTCPARMDIPDMLHLVARGDYRSAIETVKRDIALPAILGRVCPEVCENACRRGQHDSPAAICKIKQFVADRDLQSPTPFQPASAPSSGKRVAIVGGGTTAITSAYHLSQRGHAVTLFERRSELGGRLRDEFPPEQLPRNILDQEASIALATACHVQLDTEVGTNVSIVELLQKYDAVLLANGRSTTNNWLQESGVQTTTSGIRVDAATRMTSVDRLFAAGNAVRPYKLVIQSVAEGKLAAQCIDCYLRGTPVPDRRHIFETRLARLTSGELCDFCEGHPNTPRLDQGLRADQLTEELARREAQRCLDCDCSALATCKLHHYAAMYHCDAQRFRGGERRFEGRIVGSTVTLESGKCILCGICVQLTAAAPDAAGLAILGRSMETRIAPPPGISLDDAMGSAARACAEACPTGAIVLSHSCG